ncbi:hypothetical protein SuNHUV7_34430 (plasmid) [Pseudoseohaeicola sp. NH-UV-7]|uniref:hypothetical protein n=1 Tax=unclassified Sulfitobacter TaxID=196795 RepID=UPI000E09E2D9|nr:hypothetical protein [Sulfitobacter sp. JL08]AXI54664.1 hypothetical protein C1J05_09300 [Sulfitobacter sp. JL08]
MIYLHIGMPKTGTTALQNFLRAHSDALSETGVHYMQAGRRRADGKGNMPISHNPIVFDIAQGGPNQSATQADFTAEYAANADKVCLVSSEMLYTAKPADYAPLLSGIPAEDICITFFCRRYDGFFEADYKQRAKNGKITQGTTAFVQQRLADIHANPMAYNFSGVVANLRAAFPKARIIPRLYDRSTLVNGNVIDDFFDLLGAEVPIDVDTQGQSNPSLSRAGSDAFGVLTRLIGKKSVRRLRRDMPAHPVMQRKNDVLEPQEREALVQVLADSDADFREEFFGDRAALFDAAPLSETDINYRRDSAEENLALQQACELVFSAALDTPGMLDERTPPQDPIGKAKMAKVALREKRRRKRAAREAQTPLAG